MMPNQSRSATTSPEVKYVTPSRVHTAKITTGTEIWMRGLMTMRRMAEHATEGAITGGYSLTDKDATVYEFTQAGAAGIYRITKIADAAGRALSFHYDSNGRIDKLTSLSSSRTLNVTWSTPPNSACPHVATITTDPATIGNPATIQTWTYSYDNNLLKSVCEPDAGTQCTS